MSLYLTADDLRRYEKASRNMLAPKAAPTVDEWRRSVNEAVRDLVGGDKAIFLLPNAERLLYCEEEPDLAASMEDFVTAYSWAFDAQMIGEYGYRMSDSTMVSDVSTNDVVLFW